jgi:hypothetical protein
MNIDDIYGAKSRRLYRGAPKDIFKVDSIEGAHPHKVKRSPRSYAFDDYKDVTTAKKYRRPFINNSNSIQSQYFEQQFSPEPRPLPRDNYKVPVDLYKGMDYYNLPRIGEHKSGTPARNNDLKSNFKSYNHNASHIKRNFNTLSINDNSYDTPGNSGFYTQRNTSKLALNASPEYDKDLKLFYGVDDSDTLDREIMQNQAAHNARDKYQAARDARVGSQSNLRF